MKAILLFVLVSSAGMADETAEARKTIRAKLGDVRITELEVVTPTVVYAWMYYQKDPSKLEFAAIVRSSDVFVLSSSISKNSYLGSEVCPRVERGPDT